jgi:hypothetical protein
VALSKHNFQLVLMRNEQSTDRRASLSFSTGANAFANRQLYVIREILSCFYATVDQNTRPTLSRSNTEFNIETKQKKITEIIKTGIYKKKNN